MSKPYILYDKPKDMKKEEASLSELEKEAIAEIIRNDKIRYMLLEKLYNENRLIKTSDLYTYVDDKVSQEAKSKPQSYYVKILRSFEKSGLVVGVKPSIDRKNVYWKITNLGREIFERLKQNHSSVEG